MKELQNINSGQVERLKPVKTTLEKMKLGSTVIAPTYQRPSIQSTICRIKDESHKRYSIKKVAPNIIVKRIV